MFQFKGITFVDFPEKEEEELKLAVNWMGTRGCLVPCAVKNKYKAMTNDVGAYWPQWNTISLYPSAKYYGGVAPVLVHELVHAWQELHKTPKKYNLTAADYTKHPKSEQKYFKYLMHPDEVQAYYIESLFRKQYKYPESFTLDDYQTLGIDLLNMEDKK